MRICNPRDSEVNAPSLKWGKENEKNGIKDYSLWMSQEHNNFEIKECGLLLCHDASFIGATPDGIFSCKCHNLNNLIEVKCPYSLRETLSIEDVDRSKFFIDENDELRKNHKYYAQIQLQLHVLDVDICHLVVWAPEWLIVVDVRKDGDFIKSMLSTFRKFYLENVIPELLTRQIEKATESQPDTSTMAKKVQLYCYCQSADDGEQDWIGCDAVGCKYEWFHQKCAKVKRPPRGNWYCKECKAKKRKQK